MIDTQKKERIIDTLKKILEDEKWWQNAHHPIEFFAEAVAQTRNEKNGVSIEDIAKCFRAQFDESELASLIKELSK